MFQRTFGPDAVYPRSDDGTDVLELGFSVPRLLDEWRTSSEDIRVIAGHFPLCTMELLDEDFITVTVLRDPVERTLSLLRHLRQRDYQYVDATIEQIYDEPERFPVSFRSELHNHMVKMFSLTPEEMTDGILTNVAFTPDRLERAKIALSTVEAIGFQESFDSFCAELHTRFGWGADRPKRRLNRTRPMDVSDALRARIAEDNADDIALYEYARSLCAGGAAVLSGSADRPQIETQSTSVNGRLVGAGD
jgi:hypothetical protein